MNSLSPSILYVDDNADSREIISLMLHIADEFDTRSLPVDAEGRLEAQQGFAKLPQSFILMAKGSIARRNPSTRPYIPFPIRRWSEEGVLGQRVKLKSALSARAMPIPA